MTDELTHASFQGGGFYTKQERGKGKHVLQYGDLGILPSMKQGTVITLLIGHHEYTATIINEYPDQIIFQKVKVRLMNDGEDLK